MTKLEKLLKRFWTRPNDLTYEELVKILSMFGYSELRSGKTSGSSVKFRNSKNDLICFHKPHPSNIIKQYVIDMVIEKLESNGLK